MKRILCSALLVMALGAFTATTAVVMTSGCKTPHKQAYNTLASLGLAVDIAEKEYMDQVVTGRTKADDFTRIQASYSAFQQAYKAALAVTMNDTNALAPPNLATLGAKLLSDIEQAKGKKGK